MPKFSDHARSPRPRQRPQLRVLGLLIGFSVTSALLVRSLCRQLPRAAESTMTAGVRFQQYDSPTFAPPWLPAKLQPPQRRLQLAHLPTPLHAWHLPRAPPNTTVWIKRDDRTGCEPATRYESQFLLAEALTRVRLRHHGVRWSNHCRATAAAARRVGPEPHIILRGEKRDPELVGNPLIDRMVGARSPCRRGEFGARRRHLVGSFQGASRRRGKPWLPARRQQRRRYVGARLMPSVRSSCRWRLPTNLDRIYFGCGSGGTRRPRARCPLACRAEFRPTVDDSPDFFFDKMDGARCATRPELHPPLLHTPAATSGPHPPALVSRRHAACAPACIYRELGIGPSSSDRHVTLRLEDCVALSYAQHGGDIWSPVMWRVRPASASTRCTAEMPRWEWSRTSPRGRSSVHSSSTRAACWDCTQKKRC